MCAGPLVSVIYAGLNAVFCRLDAPPQKTVTAKRSHSDLALSAMPPVTASNVAQEERPANMFTPRLLETKDEQPAQKKLQVDKVDKRGMSKLTSFFKVKPK